MTDFSDFKDRDPFILLSILNSHLRDFNPNLEDFCKEHDLNINDLKDFMASSGFEYDEKLNQFK